MGPVPVELAVSPYLPIPVVYVDVDGATALGLVTSAVISFPATYPPRETPGQEPLMFRISTVFRHLLVTESIDGLTSADLDQYKLTPLDSSSRRRRLT